MKKRIISLTFVLCLVVALSLSVSAESTNKLTYAVGASAPTVSANTEFTILVEVTENTGICWLKAVVSYDSSVLTYEGHSTDTGAFASAPLAVNSSEKGSTGKVSIVLGTMTVIQQQNPTIYTQTGTLAAITFKVKADTTANSTFITVDTTDGNALKIVNGVAQTNYEVVKASKVFVISKGEHTVCVPDTPIKENNVQATCVANGSYDNVTYCIVCKKELSRETVTVPATNVHTPAEPIRENEVQATCQTDGYYDSVIKCTVCSKEISRERIAIGKGDHIPGESKIENLVDATCAAKGSYDLVVYCSACDTELNRITNELPLASHTNASPVRENLVEPTCANSGSYDNVIKCSVCGIDVNRTKVEIPTLEHTQSIPVQENLVPATCIKLGSVDQVIYCSECKTEIKRITLSVDKVDHTPGKAVKENKIDPINCGSDGTYDSVVYCSVCMVELSRVTQSIPAPQHTPGPAATETAPQICTVCNKILAPKLNHTHHWSDSWTTDAVGHWHACSGCDDKSNYEEHHYTNGCDADCNICGVTRTVAGHQYDNDCDSVCNKCSESRVIVGHVYDNSCDGICNTCSEARMITHAYDNDCDADCNICGYKRTPSDHIFGSWEVVTEPTATKEGLRQRSCLICGHVISESIPATPPETTKEPEVTTTPPETTKEPEVTTAPETTKEPEVTTEPTPGTSEEVTTEQDPGTSAPEASKPEDTDDSEDKDPGCGSAVSMGIALIAILGTALIMKKRD